MQTTIAEQTAIAEPAYTAWVRRHYGALLGIIHYVVTETADRGVDIAARALAFAAPAPNAISVYKISQTELDYNAVQALAFALVLELVLFALIEVALYMWDGYIDSKETYFWPFVASILTSLMALAIVVAVVFNLEIANGGKPIMATLPFISMAAFVGLGLKRWNDRKGGEEKERQASMLSGLRTQLVTASQAVTELMAKVGELQGQMAEAAAARNAALGAVATLEAEVRSLRQQLTERTFAAEPVGEDKGSPEAHEGAIAPSERRAEVLRLLTGTRNKGEANFTEWARSFGTSDTTIRNDLQWLIKNGYWQNGDTWKASPKASDLLGHAQPEFSSN